MNNVKRYNKIWSFQYFVVPLHSQIRMVPWMSGLVNGLQNRVHPIESGRHLTKKSRQNDRGFFVFGIKNSGLSEQGFQHRYVNQTA